MIILNMSDSTCPTPNYQPSKPSKYLLSMEFEGFLAGEVICGFLPHGLKTATR